MLSTAAPAAALAHVDLRTCLGVAVHGTRCLLAFIVDGELREDGDGTLRAGLGRRVLEQAFQAVVERRRRCYLLLVDTAATRT